MGIWVYKEDGTRQCGLGSEVTLSDMEEQLAKLVGKENILDRTKGQLPGFFPQYCGGPNGHVNLYELTSEGFYTLERGYVGPLGFQRWTYGPVRTRQNANFAGPEVPFPHGLSSSVLLCPDCAFPMQEKASDGARGPSHHDESDHKQRDPQVGFHRLLPQLASASRSPVLVRELIGYHLRVIRPGDQIILDYSWNRANIYVDESGAIKDIAFF